VKAHWYFKTCGNLS